MSYHSNIPDLSEFQPGHIYPPISIIVLPFAYSLILTLDYLFNYRHVLFLPFVPPRENPHCNQGNPKERKTTNSRGNFRIQKREELAHIVLADHCSDYQRDGGDSVN